MQRTPRTREEPSCALEHQGDQDKRQDLVPAVGFRKAVATDRTNAPENERLDNI